MLDQNDVIVDVQASEKSLTNNQYKEALTGKEVEGDDEKQTNQDVVE